MGAGASTGQDLVYSPTLPAAAVAASQRLGDAADVGTIGRDSLEALASAEAWDLTSTRLCLDKLCKRGSDEVELAKVRPLVQGQTRVSAQLEKTRKTTSEVLTLPTGADDVFQTRFSANGDQIACACSDGNIRVFGSADGKLSALLQPPAGEPAEGLPVTALRWIPFTSSGASKAVIVAADVLGNVSHWHAETGERLSTFKSSGESNQLFALDIKSDASLLAAAGSDTVVRIWDEATGQLTCELARLAGYAENTVSRGHHNRVFAVRFHPQEPKLLISGGWDEQVLVWDIRAKKSVRHIQGPKICGDALDVTGNTVLTGSLRDVGQKGQGPSLQTWDLGTGKAIAEVPWDLSVRYPEPCPIFTAQFSKGDQPLFLAAGGSKANECRVFDYGRKGALISVLEFSDPVLTVDFAPAGDDATLLAVGGSDGSLHVFEVKDKMEEDDDAFFEDL